MTESELLEAGLRQQHEHAYILLDAEGRVRAWLPAAERLFGYTAEEICGEPLRRLFPEEDVARGAPELELRTARAYGNAEDDRWQVRKDGVRIWVSGVTSAIRGADGALLGYSKIARDRTDLRGQIETLQARLEHAAHAEHERHKLLGTLAHELRNPLGPLQSATQVIYRVAPDIPEVSASLRVIERQVRFIDGLVRDLLESTRAGLGKTQLHYERVPVADIVERAIETCSHFLSERDQSVEALLPDALEIDADPVRLQQVLVNLVSNSSKFSPRNTRIWIKGMIDEDELVLRVEDHGKGIPPELLPRIFDLFTQAGSEGGKATHGLGLGLGLVRNLVELHQGTVQAKSEGAGRGTEIIMRLPVRRRKLESTP